MGKEANPCHTRRILRAGQGGGDYAAILQHPKGWDAQPVEGGVPVEVAVGIRFLKKEIGKLAMIVRNGAAYQQIEMDHLINRRRNFMIRSKRVGFCFTSTEPIILKADSVIRPDFNFMAAADFMTRARMSPSLA